MEGTELANLLRDARTRTLSLVGDLEDEQLIGPEMSTVNPLLWEIGHVSWFQERWCLRAAYGHAPLLVQGDELYDSIAVLHDARWDLQLLTRDRVRVYMERILSQVESELARGALDARMRELGQLVLFHEDMHGEAFVMTRQTLGFPCMSIPTKALADVSLPLVEDVAFEGGVFHQGTPRDAAFAFDNERGRHERTVAPFRMSRVCVTQAEYASFVADDGYQRPELWSESGWRWCKAEGARHPVYWRRDGEGWARRHFELWKPLESNLPVHHVNAYEADAYCRWKGRRLPSETEWEYAAGRTRFPWGDAKATRSHAHLDLQCNGVCNVSAYAQGDTPEGLRQMLGNVWEWTSSAFEPYPDFQPGFYREYSQPWFHDHRVVRGGAYPTRSRTIHNRMRNFYLPERSDPIVGFRTCALD